MPRKASQDAEGKFLSESGLKDAFGHAQLGGVAPMLADLVQSKLKLKQHWAVADYLQRAARHIASKTDLEQSYAVGKAAVEYAVKGMNSVMPTIVRTSSKPYRWKIGVAEALRRGQRREEDAARLHHARRLPHHGEVPQVPAAPDLRRGLPPFENGLPKYVRLKNAAVRKKTHGEWKP